MTVLVAGATGFVGGHVARLLRGRGVGVRALIRGESDRVQDLRAFGCETVSGDLKTPDSIARACAGVDGLVITANSAMSRRPGDSIRSVDRDGVLRMLATAAAAGVSRVVYVSVSPSLPADNPFVRAKRRVEAAVRSTGMTWTILQPAAFMEIHTGPVAGWDVPGGRARVVGDGRAPVSYISALDVAGFAVAALLREASSNRTLHLVGPEPLSPMDAVGIAERITGRSFTIQRVPRLALTAASAVLRPFNPILSSMLAMAAASALGDTADMSAVLNEFPVPQVRFESYVRDACSRVGVAHA